MSENSGQVSESSRWVYVGGQCNSPVAMKNIYIRELVEKFVEIVYKIISVSSILLFFAYDTGQYIYTV